MSEIITIEDQTNPYLGVLFMSFCGLGDISECLDPPRGYAVLHPPKISN